MRKFTKKEIIFKLSIFKAISIRGPPLHRTLDVRKYMNFQPDFMELIFKNFIINLILGYGNGCIS